MSEQDEQNNSGGLKEAGKTLLDKAKNALTGGINSANNSADTTVDNVTPPPEVITPERYGIELTKKAIDFVVKTATKLHDQLEDGKFSTSEKISFGIHSLGILKFVNKKDALILEIKDISPAEFQELRQYVIDKFEVTYPDAQSIVNMAFAFIQSIKGIVNLIKKDDE